MTKFLTFLVLMLLTPLSVSAANQVKDDVVRAMANQKPYVPFLEWHRVIVEDAIKRWIAKSHNDPRAVKNMIPIIMSFPTERCVQLVYVEPTPGGEPIYCYELETDSIVRVIDDVE